MYSVPLSYQFVSWYLNFSIRNILVLQRSCSPSRSPGRYDRGYDAPSASYDNRDNRDQSPYRNSYYHYRQYSPNYQDRKNNNPNGFSPVRNFNRNRYANDSEEWLYQCRYQGPSQPNFQNRPNNAGNTWNQGPPPQRLKEIKIDVQISSQGTMPTIPNIGDQRAPMNGNTHS